MGILVSSKCRQIFRVPEVYHISCNTGTCALPVMSTLALGRCVYIPGNALMSVLQLLHLALLIK